MLDQELNPYYVIPRLSGTLLLILSFALPLYLSRIEPFVPLLSAAFCLITLTEAWRKLTLKKNPIFVSAEKHVRWSIRVLAVGFFWSILTAVVATVLRTGFSVYYAVSMFAGLLMWLLGMQVGVVGLIRARSKHS